MNGAPPLSISLSLFSEFGKIGRICIMTLPIGVDSQLRLRELGVDIVYSAQAPVTNG